MSSTNIDYVNNYFEYPVLTKIHGEPKYASLRTMEDEIKANASSVSTTLGGGHHGHLGLTMLTADYTPGVAPVPYVRPVHPGPLVIPAGTTQHEATRRREDHRAAVKLFRETVDVEKALLKQIDFQGEIQKRVQI